MLKERIPTTLAEAINCYTVKAEEAREIGNEANRQKTILRNTIKDFWIANKIPIGSYVHSGGKKYGYAAVSTTILDNDAVLALYDAQEISRDQFLRMLKVDRKQAQNVLGGDVVADMETTVVGDTVDVRISSLSVEEADDEFISIMRNPVRKKKRKRFGSTALLATTKETPSTAAKPRRRVRQRRRDK